MQYVLFACGVSMVLFSCVQILTPHKSQIHYAMFVSCVSVAYVLFYFWANRAGLVVYVPALALSDIALMAPAVAGYYLVALTLVNSGQRPLKDYRRYFVVPFVFTIVYGTYNAAVSMRHFANTGGLPGRFDMPVPRTVSLWLYVAYAGATVHPLAIALHRTRGQAGAPKLEVSRQVRFLSLYLGASVFLVAAPVVRSERLLEWVVMVFGLIATAFAVLSLVASYFADAETAQAARPVIPRPDWDSSAVALNLRLEEMMNGREVFRDPELTLPQLAALLGEKPQRLSYHFKTYRATNFRSYIN